MTELPWDDAERLPALLRRIADSTDQATIELTREYRVWRARQPARRLERLEGPEREDWPGRRVARHLATLGQDAREAAAELDGDATREGIA